MKRIFILLAVALACISCEHAFRDELQEIHSEIDELRELINQTNSNIEALRTIINAIQDNDFVTGIAPIKENGVEVGYIISFSKSGNVTIYHGQDGQDGKPGQDGQPGKDGYTPVISARQDSDGIWYWTLDGEWMTDENGQRIKAVGTDGQNGQPGKDAITPQLKIEDGYWFVSYDNGDSWQQIGKATGEDGKDGDPMFSSVDCTNSDYIVMTLSDGQTIIIPTWKAFEELQEECSKANANISAMQVIITALQDNDFVQSITPLYDGTKEVGYIISFSKSGNVTIYHGQDGQPGKDGYTPVISARQDSDGIWYWTLDGEWMTDENGQRIKAVGTDGQTGQDGQPGKDAITPQLKIEDGYWFVSYDNGDSWQQIGKATGEDGKDGDPMFKDIVINNDDITLIFADGSEISLPRNTRVKIRLDVEGEEAGIMPGKEIQINYTLENATEKTFVTASSNGSYIVRVEPVDKETGRIIVKCPFIYSDGYINIMVSDGESFSFVKVVNLYEQKMIFSNGLEYFIAPHGGEISIPFSTNFDYSFLIESDAQSWLSIVSEETRAEMRDGILVIKIGNNERENSRKGKIYVIPSNSTGEIYTEIIINQASAFFSIEQSKYAVNVEGETITTMISSSRGLTVKVPADAENWISTNIDDLGNDNYKLTSVITKNTTNKTRSAIVELLSENGEQILGDIEYVQSSSITDELSNMVLKVRANFSNNFTASFNINAFYTVITYPDDGGVSASLLFEGVDCYIDWGDGQAERIYIDSNSKTDLTINHEYKTSEPKDYIVSISGKIASFSSGDRICISEVIQWGNLNLRNLEISDYLLKQIPGDNYGSFSKLSRINFQNCTSLEYIPENLFQNANSLNYLESTFSGCSSLKEIPEKLFDNCIKVNDYSNTFAYCSSLVKIPERLFEKCLNVIHFSGTFAGCSSLISIPEELFKHNTKVTTFTGTFAGCSSLQSIPEKLFHNCSEVKDFSSTFYNCTSLKDIPAKLFEKCPNVNSVRFTFAYCAITSIPSCIFDNNRRITDFAGTFYGCWNSSGESPFTVIDGVKYHLYERYLCIDQFVRPESYAECFGGGNYADKEEIQNAGWYYR